MKRIISVLLLSVVLFATTACGSLASNHDTEAVGTAGYPMTVTDQAGREVILSAEPKKLVSGYYISTSLLIALGLEDNLVGIEAKANKRPIYQYSAPQLLELPNVGTAKEFDLEGCAALDPDLIILPLKLKNAAVTLEEMGFGVILVNPEDRELLAETIALLGAATNTQERAQKLIDFLNDRVAELNGILQNVDRDSVYLAGNSDFLSTAGKGMYQSDLIELAGGSNVAGEIEDSYWVECSYEQVLEWDPSYIILASDASYTVEDVMKDANLANCTAIRNGNVYQIPGTVESWDSPVPGGILGAIWLAYILHPEFVTEEECTSIIEEFYETFYDCKINWK